MLHRIELLCSVVPAFARLVHVLVVVSEALMSLCSPTSAVQVIAAGLSPARVIKKVHPVAVAVSAKLVEGERKQTGNRDQQLLLAPPPPVVVLPVFKGENRLAEEKKATVKEAVRSRPPRLVIPPVVARAGVDPFGEAEEQTEVEARGEGFCVASRRGVRHAMEDGYGVITDRIGGDSQLAFYGVYDGHGGRAAVDFVADKLGRNIFAALSTAAATSRQQPEPSSSSSSQQEEDDHVELQQLQLDVMAAIRAGYLTTDSEFLSQGVRGGACAATALVKDGELYVANVGDCRAVLGSRGGAATALTADQTPARQDERHRIESSGGYVSCGSGGVWRVQDSLAVSRAFGDADVKPWVTCEPEIRRLKLTPDCRFLVLASDGLWNKVSNQEAVDVFAYNINNAVSMDSCKELVRMARSRGSRDDITVMAVDLQRFLR